MLCNDIYKPFIRPEANEKQCLRFSRLSIVAIFAAAAVLCMGEVGSLILGWSFLSMGLRGAVAFAPLCFALFLPGRLKPRYALTAVIAGPLLVLIGFFLLPPQIDPLFPGMAGSLLICLVGWLQGTKQKLPG